MKLGCVEDFMQDITEITNAVLFATYAGCDPEKWRLLEGVTLVNKKLGPGDLVDIDPKEDEVLLHFVFHHLPSEDAHKRFPNSAFLKGFFSIDKLPDGLDGIEELRKELAEHIHQEQEHKKEEERLAREHEDRQQKLEAERLVRLEEEKRQKEREAETAKHFMDLRGKYRVKNFKDKSPSSPLYAILLKIDDGNKLTKNDLKWLDRNSLFIVLARYYEIEASRENGDLWNVVRAGANWRKAKNPQRTLEITEDVSAGQERLNAAIMTNRGGAYRDLGHFTEAMKCAIAALKHDPNSFYVCNLLGALYYQNGEPESGDEYFQKAVELGASPQGQELELRSAMKNAEENEREIIARYLLGKDPERYKWAEYYIKG